MRLLRGRDRGQLHDEGRPHAGRAVQGELAAVRAHDVAGDGEAETGAGPPVGARLVVALEEPGAIGVGDADAGVAHQDPARGAVGRGADEDGAAVLVVGDGVREQVVDDLAQPQRIGPGGGRFQAGHVDRDGAPGGARQGLGGSGGHEVARVDGLRSEGCLHRGGRRTRRGEDVGHDAQQPLGVALGDVEVGSHGIGGVGVFDREVEVAEDRCERGAQLVRDTDATRSSRARSAVSSAVTSRETTTAPASAPSGSVSRRAVIVSAGADRAPRRTRPPGRRTPRRGARARAELVGWQAVNCRRRGTPGPRRGRRPARSPAEAAVRLVGDGDASGGGDADDAEIDRVEHLGHDLLLASGAREDASAAAAPASPAASAARRSGAR